MSRHLNKNDAFLLDRLLSGRDQLAPAEREQVFAKAVAQSQARSPASRWTGWPARLSLVAGTAALAALAFWLVPIPTQHNNEFAHRGAMAEARLSLSCANASESEHCHVGDKLMFQITAPEQQRHFAAFARRADNAVIWYFPSQEGDHSIEVNTHGEANVLRQGIYLGSEHSVGSYQVTAIFSAAPLTQEQIRHAVTHNQLVPPEYSVVQRRFTVDEATP